MNYTCILLAAGKGSRTNLDYNKVFYHLDDKTVLEHSISRFLADPDCTQILVMAAPHETEEIAAVLPDDPRISVLAGGNTRQDSVYNGLLKTSEETVFIHDAARPWLKEQQLEQLKHAMEEEDAALLMVPSTDTVKLIDGDYVAKTLNRNQVWCAQTPQAFRTSLIRKCHEKAREKAVQATDDTQLAEMFGRTSIRVVHGDPSNTKITTSADIRLDD